MPRKRESKEAARDRARRKRLDPVYAAAERKKNHERYVLHKQVFKDRLKVWRANNRETANGYRRNWYARNILGSTLPQRPAYERPDIPHEEETELPLLVRFRAMLCLDDSLEDGALFHEFIASPAKTPLELLMEKEFFDSPEWRERERRMEEWLAYQERKNAA
jgi:hypothetical protein